MWAKENKEVRACKLTVVLMKVNNNQISAHARVDAHTHTHPDTPEDTKLCLRFLERTDGHNKVRGTLLASRKVE